METIIQNAWIQGGAVGLLIASGWIMWWLERQERVLVQQRRDNLLETFLNFMNDYKDLLEQIAESMAIQKLIQEEFAKYINRSKSHD